MATIETILSVEVTDGISALSSLVKAMQFAGAPVSMHILDGPTERLVKIVTGEADGKLHFVALPSPLFLRCLADQIEKLPR